MKEVEIHAWCDACLSGDATADSFPGGKVPGETHLLKVDDLGGLELELCDTHDKALLEPLRRLLAEHGAPPPRPEPQPAKPAPVKTANGNGGTVACPLCASRVSRYALPTHLYTVHGGLGSDEERPRQTGACPECGEEYEQLAHHRGRAHGVTAADFALQWVRDHGAVK